MRSSKGSSRSDGSMASDPRPGLARALKFAAAALGIGLVVSASGVAAYAGDDDDDDDMTFEEKIIDNLMTGLGAKGAHSKPGIDYRERSPLVVPPSLDLPPPAAVNASATPNWPKDPDEKRRKEAMAERKKAGSKRAKEAYEAARPLTPAEMNVGRTAAAPRENNDPIQPGVSSNPSMSPAQLGYTGGLWNMFKGNNSSEAKKFTSEPPRESLVEPPTGYQTPSPNYAYGTGPDKVSHTYFDINAGKEREQ